MCNRKVSWDERKDAAGNGISCVRERTSGGEMDLLGELDMAVAGAYRSGRGPGNCWRGCPGTKGGLTRLNTRDMHFMH